MAKHPIPAGRKSIKHYSVCVTSIVAGSGGGGGAAAALMLLLLVLVDVISDLRCRLISLPSPVCTIELALSRPVFTLRCSDIWLHTILTKPLVGEARLVKVTDGARRTSLSPPAPLSGAS